MFIVLASTNDVSYVCMDYSYLWRRRCFELIIKKKRIVSSLLFCSFYYFINVINLIQRL